MVKVIMGVKGTGKTKQLIDLVNQAVKEETGDIVCLEKSPSLTYDIPYKVRLISAKSYPFGSYDFFRGFVCARHAGNYDVTHVFIDNLFKMLDDNSSEKVEELLNWLDNFSTNEGVRFTITISADVSEATEGMKKFF